MASLSGLIDPRRLVFIDETPAFAGAGSGRDQHDPPARLAPKGERLADKVPHGWKTATFLAALRKDRIEAPCRFDRPINGERSHANVEQFLVPTLKPGDVVILDNLGSQKGKAVRRAIHNVWARLVFPPKYSPDINPIEQVFANFKPRCQRREREATKPYPNPALRSSLNTHPKNAPHTSETPAMRQPKSRTL